MKKRTYKTEIKTKHWKLILEANFKDSKGIDYKDLKEKYLLEFTMLGDLFYRKGNKGRFGFYGCGQIYDTLLTTIVEELSDDKKNLLLELIELWNKYHLNFLIAGTYRQEELLNKYKKDYDISDYNIACNILEKNNLLIDNGYKYGSKWLCKKLPDNLEDKIKELFHKLEN